MQCKANSYWNFKYEMQLLECDKYARDRKLTFLWAQGHSSLSGGVSSCSTSEALSGSGDDDVEDGSFFLRHLFLLFFFLIDFSGSSVGFGFFILILFGCFFFSCFSSKRVVERQKQIFLSFQQSGIGFVQKPHICKHLQY